MTATLKRACNGSVTYMSCPLTLTQINCEPKEIKERPVIQVLVELPLAAIT